MGKQFLKINIPDGILEMKLHVNLIRHLKNILHFTIDPLLYSLDELVKF